jgi:CRP-like cAMP-binding protein
MTQRNRGEEIHGSDRPDDYCYRVLSGAARCYIVLPSGRRHIMDLLLPGDFFAFAPCGGHYCGVDALADNTVVACFPCDVVKACASADPAIAARVREMALGATARMQQLILILGRTTAREKVGSFLLAITERTSSSGADRVVLPTSRYDIADYLALSVETVSRSLTELKQRGSIALAGPRRVRIVDRHELGERDQLESDCLVSRATPRHPPEGDPGERDVRLMANQ